MDMNVTEEEKRIARDEGIIHAIKAYRDRTGVTLGTAKNVCEQQCDGWREAQAARYELARKREQEEMERVKKECFEDLGIETNPKRELLWQKAWDLGHAYGVREVKAYAADLVELIK